MAHGASQSFAHAAFIAHKHFSLSSSRLSHNVGLNRIASRFCACPIRDQSAKFAQSAQFAVKLKRSPLYRRCSRLGETPASEPFREQCGALPLQASR